MPQSMQLSVVAESAITEFSFWFADSLRQGMTYDSELYACVAHLSADAQPDALSLATQLLQQGIPVLVTLGEHCRLWKSLRTQYW